ncbi:Exportin-6-B, partial [Ooceraea biroi]
GQAVPSESPISIMVMPLTQLLEDCASSSMTIKKMLHWCLESIINRTLELLSYVIRCQSICEMLLSFLHSAFSVLQQQLGSEFTQNAVQGMLQLCTRSHNLLADEIAAAIHSLASVNIGWFFGYFLPTVLTTCQGVDDMQRAILLENFDKSTDQPTLTRSVLQLISDLRCYQLCRPR